MIDQVSQQLLDYYNDQSNAYSEHLQELISIKVSQKEEIKVNLSEEEQLLALDSDWLANFKEKLSDIERG